MTQQTYCVVPTASQAATSPQACTVDNTGLSMAGAQTFFSAVIPVLFLAVAFRIAIRFFSNRR